MNTAAKYRESWRRCIGSSRYLLAGVMLIGIGVALGSVVTRPSTAWGEVRAPSPPEHFQSGSQLSLPVLQDISATLRQIDARLARLEAAAKQLQTKHVRSLGQ